MIRAAQPAAQEPEQLVARTIQALRMQRAQHGKLGLQVHQVVEAVNEFAHTRFAAN